MYANNNDGGLDLILTGAVTVHKEAERDVHEFVARCLVDIAVHDAPKIQHYQVLIPVSKEAHVPLFGLADHSQ